MRSIRAFLPAVALAATVLAAPVAARPLAGVALVEAAAGLAPGKYLWEADAAAGPVSVLVSIPDQKAYVFRGETLVAVSTVSTGRDGNETPVGNFTILQKKEMHRSNLYDDAPMPFMQRLTWDGVAIHAGRNPGFADSHGCIRVPAGFAKKLFSATELGATVEVTDVAYAADTPAPRSDAQETASANARAQRDLDTFLASR